MSRVRWITSLVVGVVVLTGCGSPHTASKDRPTPAGTAVATTPVPRYSMTVDRSSNPTEAELVDLIDGWIVISWNGAQFICRDGGQLDHDCARFYGGDPPAILQTALRCSGTRSLVRCTDDGYYPSALDGFESYTIANGRALCRGDGRCWAWIGGGLPLTGDAAHDFDCEMVVRTCTRHEG